MGEVLGGVLVTGAGGFIGSHVVRHLSRDPNLTVVSATRDGRAGSRKLDLLDPDSLPAALHGIDAVVHCAVGNRSVTVDGTGALLQAATGAGVKRVVHLSSVAVYGSADGDLDETAKLTSPSGESYAAWKSAAEAACQAQTGVQTVRLRPTIVYGAGSTLWVLQLARRIWSGRWGVFGAAGEGVCNLVHVSDVAAAVAAALVRPGVAGRAFNINGPEPTTWNRWFLRFAEAIGAPPLTAISPRTLHARSIAALPLKALARLHPAIGRNWLLGAPAASELALFSLRAHYPVTAAEHALDWRPVVPIQEGLDDCVRWLREAGLAK